MDHPEVYELSKKFGPPKVDLRQATIEDDYGSEDNAGRQISHRRPEDVTREHLDFYGSIYPYLETTDFLFYLYPIAREFAAGPPLDCIDSYLYSLNDRLDAILERLDETEVGALKAGLHWIWQTGGDGYADWHACRNLQRFIGIKA